MLQEGGPIRELSILNRHPKVLDGPELLHELVRTSSTNGFAIDFLEDGWKRRQLSYETLHAASDALAKRIIGALARLKNASAIVPVLLPQSAELYITLLAILKAGKAFCPIGLDTPAERLSFILKDISADLIITTSTQANNVPRLANLQVLFVDSDQARVNNLPNSNGTRVKSTDLAYVLYTSGSTGLPKAVGVSHRAVTQSLLAHDRHVPHFTRFLQFAAPTFDVSIFEIFFPLYKGCTLVGCTRSQMLNDLPYVINSMNVDAAELTPTVASNLLNGRKSVPGLRLLLTIGEMLTRHVVNEFANKESKESILWGMYGPTETAIHCTLQPSFSRQSPVGNIGFPLDTVLVLIASPVTEGDTRSRLEVLPAGATGELVIGGPQVAEGYINRPELTKSAFITHPEYGYLYRTGDKARLCADGNLECLGRIVSGQVKLRGQRIELGEIEHIILRVEACRSATVMVIEDTLIAFCTIGAVDVARTTVTEICKCWLPSYMVPTEVILLQHMPQLSSGKVDRKLLEERYRREYWMNDHMATQSSHTSQHLVTGILQKCLGRDLPLGADLGSIGLDSLRSIRIASSLREQGYSVGPIDVLSAPNLETLITTCERSSQRQPARETSIDVELYVSQIPLLKDHYDEIEDIIGCTPLQEAMLTETNAKPSTYCNWIEVELCKALDFNQIWRCLEILVHQNEILRSGFFINTSTSDSFVQIIWKRLRGSAIREVTSFSRSYSLGSSQSLLQPFTVQVITSPTKSRLLFQVHHALYDGWSFDILLRDLSDILGGRTLEHRPQFRQVVEFYQQIQRSPEAERSKDYWAGLLRDYYPISIPNFNGKTIRTNGLHSIRGESSVNSRTLFASAKKHAINPQVFFQAASAHILSWYLGSSDVVIGTVTSGRTIPVTHVEDILGPCIASLPFRLELSQYSTISALLQDTQRMNREMLQHCALPLREITKLCKLRPGDRPFDILFVWQQSLVSRDDQSLAARIVDSADDLEFKITLEFEPHKDCLLYRFTYDPSIIPRRQVEHLARQIDQIVNYYLSSTDGKVQDVGQCFTADVVSIANPMPKQESIENGPASPVEKWALETPNREAVVVGKIIDGAITVKESITYVSLNDRANQLARALIEHGVKEDQLVCIFLEKSANLYVSILAVLKVGCGYLPIVPDTPAERTKRILEDAEVAICITDSTVMENLPKTSLTTLELDRLDLSGFSSQNLDIPYYGSHLAYAVFTSGSTGKPKGVLVTQDNLMSNLSYLASIYPTSKDSRMLQSCSQAFDVSAFEIFFAWYVGMCLCTATKDDLFYNFEAAIDVLDITHLSLTPTVAGLVDPDHVPRVKFLVTAGEAITENVRRKWAGKGLFQGYGPSETTNICTVKPFVTTDDSINNIGPPFSNTSAIVLEPGTDFIVPRGAIGELCFGGAQVFRGYLKMPELNAEKIIDHPKYGRIYRSGDMGLLLPDNSILFTRRLDDQVKVRGQRVELGEITSVVLDHSAVDDCATLLLQNDNGHQRLVTFWVPKKAAAAEFSPLPVQEYRSVILDIFEIISLHLPSYMAPTHLVPISNIPMTPQAKIDKRTLRSTFSSLSKAYLESTASRQDAENDIEVLSASERKVAEALTRTLGISVEDIKRTSSFFNLGLDSVSAIHFAKGLRNAGLGHLPVSVILKNSTVQRLASIATTENQSTLCLTNLASLADVFSSEQISLIRSGFQNPGRRVHRILPCTPLQEAMLSSSSSTASSYYNMMVFQIIGRLEQMKKAWELVIERNDIFRTAFEPTDNPRYSFAQVVLEHEPVEWDRLRPNEEPTIYVAKILSSLLQSHSPPVRLAFQDAGDTTKLIFCCHHALYDGTAISALLNEVQATYLEDNLPPPVPYERYLRHMVSQDPETADQFWKTSLAGFEPTFFPNLSSQVLGLNAGAASYDRPLQIPLSQMLRFCQSSSISLLSMVQAAWAKLLHFCMGESDLCFGNVVSGRTLPEEDLDRLIAPCFNTLPVRLNFGFRNPNMELCRRLHSFNIDSLAVQLTPLRQIQAKVLKEQGRLFDTLVILQQPSTLLDSSIWSLEQDVGDMDLPVVCELFQDKESDILRLVLHYQKSLMLEKDAGILTEIFDNALQSLIQLPEVSANDTIGFSSHSLSYSNSNFKHLAHEQGELLHSGFEQMAALRPNATALDFRHASGERTSITFNELNCRANQLAHALIQHGIQPEDIIPVHIPKSPEYYASILGILKAGAAFVPVHPDLPEARKQFMLSELQPKVIFALQDVISWYDNVPCIDVSNIRALPIENPTISNLKSSNLAYCLYTSGSTGLPKAVSMEHRCPIQTIESSRSLIPWTQESRLLQYAAITFDMCYYDCFLAWTYGFTLCAAEQETMLNNLTETINSLDIDLLDLTPSVAASLQKNEVPGVKWLYCIGEAMTPEVVKEWAGTCVNSYGPTEAAFCTTIFSVDKNIKTSVIGQPFPTTTFAIFPPEGDRPVPILGVGELYIGGAQLARGYFGKPELTEDKFVQKCGQRFYKSGDTVRMLSDNNFEFIGRVDDQVKIRGLRVELGEISHVLQDSSDAFSAVTTQILRTEGSSKDQLIAFLVPRQPIDADERSQLRLRARKAAADKLPLYMVPQFLLFIDRIPKSMAGKVDKKALTQIFRDSEDVKLTMNEMNQDASAHEWTQVETEIRSIFSKLSNTPAEDISPWASIYQLGLDSISAVQVATALRKQGFAANAADIMKYMNCKDLAIYLEEASLMQPSEAKQVDFGAFESRHRADVVKACHVKDADVEAIRPCTPLQNGMLSQFVANDGTIYLNYLRLRLDGGIDVERLKSAWSTVVRKHAILRTGFANIKDSKTPFAMIHYRPRAQNFMWSDPSTGKASDSAEKWLSELQRHVVKQLHLAPWCVRVIKEKEESYLDLAILHAIFDAQSLRLIFNDVKQAYENTSIGTASLLDPVIGNILHLSNADNNERRDFWRRVANVSTPTRFPNLTPLREEPASPLVVSKLSSRTLEDLHLGCRDANISLQVAGMASWATLLAAYTGESAATFGVVLSGRSFDGSDSAVFPCITTVPFVCTTSGSKEEILKRTSTLNAEIQQHQFTPLNEIQRLMGHPNEPLFDTIFAFQKLAEDGSDDGLWKVVDEEATIEYPISIELEPKGGQLEYRLTFLPHVVPKEQAQLVLDQLDHLIQYYIFAEPVPHSPSDPQLYSITPAKDPTIPSQSKLLHEMFERTAAQHPDRIALEFVTEMRNGTYDSRPWTYAELNAKGNQIAQLLIKHRVRLGALVAICFDKCPEASFAMLGILKAGCAFVAIDPGAPTARKAFIAEDSGASVILSMKSQSANIKENVRATILNLDEVDLRSVSTKKPSLERVIEPQDLSYCLYTSGTTGTPKGCELTHENAVQALLSFQRLFAGHWDGGSRWLQFASFHFDVSVLEQYWSWSVGICVVSAPRDLIFEDIATSIRTLGITHIDLTPSLARILHPDDVPSLCKGVFITGGESLKQEILDVWGPKGVIYNGYGPTEATIGVTMYTRVPANGKPSNIGSQFDNVGSYVLQPGSDVAVLRGGVGELCVSGKLVGKGYLKRPELTKERFPHLSLFNEKVYRTGDLVRILHNGNFDFLGRADDQVKLRGQRLEIGEINSVIKQSAIAASDVATLVLKHPKQQKEQLVSFIVANSGGQGDARIALEKTSTLEKAKEACQEKLPPYMVPTHFVALTTLPLSANNKADARRLKEMYEVLSVNDLQVLSSITQLKKEGWSKQEAKVRNVLQDSLEIQLDDLSKDASFFELGMDSISVIGVSRALKQAGYSKATASTVMKNATCRRLAKFLSDKTSASLDRGSIIAAQQAITAVQHRHRRAVAETLFTDARNIEALAPCTPLQQGMIARSLDSEHGLYFNTFQFKLGKQVDSERMCSAWETVFMSTQILRTVFVNTEDGFVQAALRKASLRFENITVQQEQAIDDHLNKLRQQWVQRNRVHIKSPLELIIVDSPKRKSLVIHIFHALYDGNSIGLMFRAVLDAFNNREINSSPSFQSALAYGPLRPVDGAREFWERHLVERAFSSFPTLIDEGEENSTSITRSLDDLGDFEGTRRKLNVTAQAIAQACWTIVLHEHIKRTVTMGMVVSGRSIDFDNADQVIGPLFNTIPYQFSPQKRDTLCSVIKRTHDFNIAAHPYQHTPSRDINKWCKRTASQPLFDTLFVYQVADGGEEWTENDVWQLMDGGADADYPLAIEVEQSGSGGLKITLVAQGHISNKETSEQMLEKFEDVLRQAMNDPDAILQTFAVQSEETDETVDEDNKPAAGPVVGTRNFTWTKNAIAMKEEISNLADTDLEDINETTSIFELGLDSIDAIKLSSRLKKRGIDLAVSGIMRSLNIANMTQHISTGKKNWSQRPSDMIFQSHKRRLESYLQRHGLTEGVQQILPLTPLQEAMVAEMIASDYTRYYNNDVLRLAPGTDVKKLQQAWMEVVKKSPVLRTSFIQVDDPGIDFSFAQVIHEEPHVFWNSVKVNSAPDFRAIFEELRQEAASAPGQSPLFSIRHIYSPKQGCLVLSIAHALYDGWSLGLLHNDVQQAYLGKFKVRPSYEPALHEILTTSGSDAAAFWRDYLADAKKSDFPRRARPEIEDATIVHRKEQASNLALRKVTAFAKRNNISLQTLGQTVYACTLASYIGSLDVTFGSVLSGRDDGERAKLLFPTMNTVAIRTILHGTRKELLQYVQENFTNIKQWQHFPLRKALSLAGAQAGLFESLFIYQKRMGEEREHSKLYESVQGQSDVEYLVCVEMEAAGEELLWRCAVKREVFDEDGAQNLLDRLDRIMESIMEQPGNLTIEFKAEGASVCGLPIKEEKTDDSYGESEEDEGETSSGGNSSTEKAIREVLAFASKTPEEDITEGMNIFHMGLDSISAIKVSSLLRKRGIVLSVGEMLKAGTVEKMAQIASERAPEMENEGQDVNLLLEEALADIDQKEILKQAGIGEKEVERILPATAGQTYMLSMWLNSNGAIFYPEFNYQVHGSANFETLQRAWQDVVTANPILRTSIQRTSDSRIPYIQIMLGETQPSILDITDWSEERVAEAMTKRPSKQPYVHLFASKSSTGWDLRLKVHHALYDGVSLPLLMQRLQDRCNNIEVVPTSDTFGKFIASTSSSPNLESRKSFWKNYLKGIEQNLLPQLGLALSSKVEIFKPGLLPDTSAIESMARKHGITTQSLFLAIYAKRYATLTSSAPDADIVIGIYLANRSLPIPNLAQAAIPTVNLVPLRVSNPLKSDILEVAAQMQYDIQEISSPANSSVSLWEVEQWTGIQVDTFVNFLKLPDIAQGEASEQRTRITQAGQWDREVSRVNELDTAGWKIPEQVVDERVNGSYLHAIDVEATIRNGALDVGVFATVGMLSLEGVERLVEGIRLEFENLGSENV